MKGRSNVFPNNKESRKDIVSSNKQIKETHVVEKLYYTYLEMTIKKTKIGFHYTTEITSMLTVTLMKCQKAGFH